MTRKQIKPIERTIAQSIGKQLKKAREAEGLTQSEVGQAIAITRSGYAYIELGSSIISVPQLIILCDCLGISPTEIINEIELNGVKVKTWAN